MEGEIHQSPISHMTSAIQDIYMYMYMYIYIYIYILILVVFVNHGSYFLQNHVIFINL
jgi:hypothetical protein